MHDKKNWGFILKCTNSTIPPGDNLTWRSVVCNTQNSEHSRSRAASYCNSTTSLHLRFFFFFMRVFVSSLLPREFVHENVCKLHFKSKAWWGNLFVWILHKRIVDRLADKRADSWKSRISAGNRPLRSRIWFFFSGKIIHRLKHILPNEMLKHIAILGEVWRNSIAFLLVS